MIDKTNLTYYEVGGSVRDELLGKEPKDRDYVVVGHTAEEMEERGFKPIRAQSFPVFLDENGDEWALARKEKKVEGGYKGFETFTDDVSLKEDLERRDLTINAMAKDPETGEVIDPFDGRDDLKKKRLHPVSKAFKEDPVRVLRAVRYRQRFGFHPSGKLVSYCRDVAHELNHVPNERIGQEFVKTFEQAETMGSFLQTLELFDALKYISPELAALRQVPAGPLEHHGEGDTLTHTQMVMNEMFDTLGNDPVGLTMAMLHDVGKAVTLYHRDEDTHYGHDEEGIDIAAHVCRHQLKLSNEFIEAAKTACRQHMRFHDIPEMRASKVIRLVDKLRSRKGASIEQMKALAGADSAGRVSPEEEFESDLVNLLDCNRHIVAAEKVIDEVDAEEALQDREGGIDDYDGEAIGNMILQERISRYRGLINDD